MLLVLVLVYYVVKVDVSMLVVMYASDIDTVGHDR